jgi:hypothetical protein
MLTVEDFDNRMKKARLRIRIHLQNFMGLDLQYLLQLPCTVIFLKKYEKNIPYYSKVIVVHIFLYFSS